MKKNKKIAAIKEVFNWLAEKMIKESDIPIINGKEFYEPYVSTCIDLNAHVYVWLEDVTGKVASSMLKTHFNLPFHDPNEEKYPWMDAYNKYKYSKEEKWVQIRKRETDRAMYYHILPELKDYCGDWEPITYKAPALIKDIRIITMINPITGRGYKVDVFAKTYEEIELEAHTNWYEFPHSKPRKNDLTTEEFIQDSRGIGHIITRFGLPEIKIKTGKGWPFDTYVSKRSGGALNVSVKTDTCTYIMDEDERGYKKYEPDEEDRNRYEDPYFIWQGDFPGVNTIKRNSENVLEIRMWIGQHEKVYVKKTYTDQFADHEKEYDTVAVAKVVSFEYEGYKIPFLEVTSE